MFIVQFTINTLYDLHICLQAPVLSLASFAFAVLPSEKVLATLSSLALSLALSLASLASLPSKETKSLPAFPSLSTLSSLPTWVKTGWG